MRVVKDYGEDEEEGERKRRGVVLLEVVRWPRVCVVVHYVIALNYAIFIPSFVPTHCRLNEYLKYVSSISTSYL